VAGGKLWFVKFIVLYNHLTKSSESLSKTKSVVNTDDANYFEFTLEPIKVNYLGFNFLFKFYNCRIKKRKKKEKRNTGSRFSDNL
jgi:hypothetical protein